MATAGTCATGFGLSYTNTQIRADRSMHAPTPAYIMTVILKFRVSRRGAYDMVDFENEISVLSADKREFKYSANK